MTRKTVKFLSMVALGSVALYGCQPGSKEESTSGVKPPVAEKVPHTFAENGANRVDNYYWMKLTDEQKNAEKKDEQTTKVLNYLTAENDYLKAELKHTEQLQDKIYNEIVGRIKQT